tara:strand:+ start:407 stop:892 length:486 start_codon:yes stop_codon:yes gene_type:complete
MLFKLHGVDLMLIYDKYLYFWYDTSGGRKIKNPRWIRKNLTLNANNYLVTSINGRMFKFHRIVYFAHNRKFDIYNNSDDNMIDHIDGNKLNNHIFNLRVVNNHQNQINSNQYRTAKGYTKRGNKFEANIRINGKREYLGTYDTEQEAHDVFLTMREQYHKD